MINLCLHFLFSKPGIIASRVESHDDRRNVAAGGGISWRGVERRGGRWDFAVGGEVAVRGRVAAGGGCRGGRGGDNDSDGGEEVEEV
jgi:hypothetical protein